MYYVAAQIRANPYFTSNFSTINLLFFRLVVDTEHSENCRSDGPCWPDCRTEDLKGRCGKCKIAHYCSRDCQEEAWHNHHKAECKYLRNMQTSYLQNDAILLMIRIILKLQNNGYQVFSELPNGEKRYYKDLISHDEKRTFEENFRLEMTYGILEKILERNILLSKSDVFEIYGKLSTNAHEMENESLKVIASGLYLGSSAINHSCAPNAHWITRGKKNVLRTFESTVLESVSNAY